jgi:glycosyltransferase involved in cell wall biosynthesis
MQTTVTPKQNCPLRIALVTETFPPELNGVAVTIACIVRGLCKRGHAIELIRPRQGPSDHGGIVDGVEHFLKPSIPIPKYPSLRVGLPATRSLERLWLDRRPDVVHVVTEGPLAWSAAHAARRLGIPLTSDFHTNFHTYSTHYGFKWLKRPISAYLRKLHNLMDVTFVATEQFRVELETFGIHNLAVIPRGVDTQLFNPARRRRDLRRNWGADDRTLVVLYVGRLAPEKNIDLVFRAFEEMRAEHSDVRLVLVGDGPKRAELERRHRSYHFAGIQKGERLAEHYASGDVFLFPSLTETFGNVTVEAMASGLAVVAYDYAAAREYIVHNQSGLVAPFDDTVAFARLARELASSHERVLRLGAHARIQAQAIDWERVFNAFEAELQRIIRMGRAGTGTEEKPCSNTGLTIRERPHV